MIHFAYEDSETPEKPVIVFLHGFLGNRSDWDRVTSGLKVDFRCISVDLPGHGETGFPESMGAVGMRHCADALTHFINSKMIDQYHLVGYSMGGRLALYLALHYSGRIKKVVIESGSPGLRTENERKARRYHDDQLAQRLEFGNYSEFLNDWYSQPLFTTIRQNPRLYGKMISSRLGNDPLGLARSLREMGTGVQPNLWPKLPFGKCPLLLLVGSKDRKFRGIANDIIELYPESKINLVKCCGHNIHFEATESFISTIRPFLEPDLN